MKSYHRGNVRKPSAFWLRGGLPKAEAMADEFTGSVYGAAALGYMAVIHALDACDMLEERCPRLLTGKAKAALRSLTSVSGEVEKLRVRLSLAVRSKADASWLMDRLRAGEAAHRPLAVRRREHARQIPESGGHNVIRCGAGGVQPRV